MASAGLRAHEGGTPGASGPSAGPGLGNTVSTEEVVFCKEPASTVTILASPLKLKSSDGSVARSVQLEPARFASSGLTMGGFPETPTTLTDSRGGGEASGETGIEDEEFFDTEDESDVEEDIFNMLGDIDAVDDAMPICNCERRLRSRAVGPVNCSG